MQLGRDVLPKGVMIDVHYQEKFLQSLAEAPNSGKALQSA
jgi:hypothetical protein